MKEMPAFDDALEMIVKRAARFNPERVNQEDIAATATPMSDEES